MGRLPCLQNLMGSCIIPVQRVQAENSPIRRLWVVEGVTNKGVEVNIDNDHLTEHAGFDNFFLSQLIGVSFSFPSYSYSKKQ
jgi:hypothetical protein